MKGFLRKCRMGLVAAPAAVLCTVGLAMAEPTITVPAIDTGVMTDSANAVFVAVALFVAVGMGIRMFRKG